MVIGFSSATSLRLMLLNNAGRNYRKFVTFLSLSGDLTLCNSSNNVVNFKNEMLASSHFFSTRQIEPNEKRPSKRSMPPLMDFPEILWPSALKTIKNWILVQFIIRPYFDNEFNLRDFIYGAKQALQVISTKLGNSDTGSLKSLVTDDAIYKLKSVLETLSVSQRQQLEVKEEDIYLSFPYQIGIIFDESDEQVQKRWIEITVVFHVLRGFKEIQRGEQSVPWNLGVLPEYQDKVFICNYRFIKEFTQGKQSDWIVNIVNHFKPIDLLIE